MGNLQRRTIGYRRQPTNSSCTHTCVAMYKGIDPQEVIDRFPGESGSNVGLRRMLAHYQIPVIELNPALWLNVPGFAFLSIAIGHDQRHYVLVEVMANDRVNIWDPALGQQDAVENPYLGDIAEVLVVIADDAEEHGFRG